MAYLELRHIEKSFGKRHVVKDLSLSIEKHEFVTLLGPSGCGKTTVLRMIAGFEQPDSGEIEIEGESLLSVPANKRGIGMVFQSYALFPNLNARQNISFGMEIAGYNRRETEERVRELLEVFHLKEVATSYPSQLSGGEQQRVALARAIIMRPKLLLLDEPLSALDAKIRAALRDELREIHRRFQLTTVFVTHDQEEGLSMSDAIAVINDGIVEQYGTPVEIYNRPLTPFVAGFVGRLNLLDCEVVDGSKGIVRFGDQELKIQADADLIPGEPIQLTIRPENIALEGNVTENRLTGRLKRTTFGGAWIRMEVSTLGRMLILEVSNDPRGTMPQIGDEVSLYIRPEDLVRMVKRIVPLDVQ